MRNNIIYYVVFCVLLTGHAISQECEQENPCFLNQEYYNYLKLGAGGIKQDVGPNVGIGRRFVIDQSAVDFSINFMGRDKAYYFSAPKMMYLRYFTPYDSSSLYVGGGLSLGSIRNERIKFSGLLAEAVVGYEMHRYTSMTFFAELNFSHGALPFHSKYRINHFSPAVSFSVGAGF